MTWLLCCADAATGSGHIRNLTDLRVLCCADAATGSGHIRNLTDLRVCFLFRSLRLAFRSHFLRDVDCLFACLRPRTRPAEVHNWSVNSATILGLFSYVFLFSSDTIDNDWLSVTDAASRHWQLHMHAWYSRSCKTLHFTKEISVFYFFRSHNNIVGSLMFYSCPFLTQDLSSNIFIFIHHIIW